jgi:hypothetical protein
MSESKRPAPIYAAVPIYSKFLTIDLAKFGVNFFEHKAGKRFKIARGSGVTEDTP